MNKDKIAELAAAVFDAEQGCYDLQATGTAEMDYEAKKALHVETTIAETKVMRAKHALLIEQQSH